MDYNMKPLSTLAMVLLNRALIVVPSHSRYSLLNIMLAGTMAYTEQSSNYLVWEAKELYKSTE